MANKRMFNIKIVDSDAFLDMPLTTQCLYFHLNMRADDDGFVGNPKRIQRLIGATEDDLKLLIAKRFILVFEDGVIVIKHWKIHNCIQADRYTPTVYQDEKNTLVLKQNKAYTLDSNNHNTTINTMETKCIQNVSTDIDKDIDIELDKELDIYSRVELDNAPLNTNKKSSLDDETKDNIAVIVEYLNQRAGTNYRTSTQNTIKHIKARLNEKYTVNDFKTVIDKKCAEWKGTQMEQYLRPATLFGTNFENYLNSKININNKTTVIDNNTVEKLSPEEAFKRAGLL